MHQAFASQVRQDYPEFEILFGVQDASDPAIREVERLQAEFPDAALRLIIGGAPAANQKVGTLMNLAEYARCPIWIVNDSDIRVTPEYLREVVSPLSDPEVGLVTCLYRPRPHSLAGAWEALGIATDFMPSTLVAPLVGVREFGLGSTLAFRAGDLKRAGGFSAIAPYLADDYQLAKRIAKLGKRAVLSTYTVETSIGESTLRGVWQHQLRWGRTIRLSKGGGYAGLPITHAGVWAALSFATGNGWMGILLLALRIGSALTTGGLVLRSNVAVAMCWLAPAWDFFAFVLWICSYLGRTVRWRGRELVIDSEGRIQV